MKRITSGVITGLQSSSETGISGMHGGSVLEEWLTLINEAKAVPSTFHQGKFPGSSSVSIAGLSQAGGQLVPAVPVMSTASGVPHTHFRTNGINTVWKLFQSTGQGFAFSCFSLPLLKFSFRTRNPSRKFPSYLHFMWNETDELDAASDCSDLWNGTNFISEEKNTVQYFVISLPSVALATNN